ncbi:MAG: dethiobiotin synthase [Campylobacterota bacterium]|nr:dethiobiotin synthase [Campylobacterota bacterium]
MAKRIFITATNTDIGKTHATKLLLKAYAQMGYRVGVFKPIETGVVSLPEDGQELLELIQKLNPECRALHVNDIVPIQFKLPAAPYIANNAKDIDKEVLTQALDKLELLCDIILIEGAGGLYVPVDTNTMIIDLISYFNAKALLITHCKLGCINDTLLSCKALESQDISYEWALNCREQDSSFTTVSKPYFDDTFKNIYSINDDIFELAEKLIN